MRLSDQALQAMQAQDLAMAEALLSRALLEDAEDGHAMLVRAMTRIPDQPGLSRALIRAACRRRPADPQTWFNLAIAEKVPANDRASLDHYRRALALAPLDVGALINGSELLRVNEHFAEALDHALRLQGLRPDLAAGYHNAAICLAHLDRHKEADGHFARAIALSPDPALIRWEYHHSLLARQRFAEAWQAYETRFHCGNLVGVDDMAFTVPRWNGEDPSDLHILVYAEQGLGDQIMWASMFAELVAVAGKVSLVTNPLLAGLFAASFPQIEVRSIVDGRDPAQCQALIDHLALRHPVDRVMPMGSLPGRFRRELSAFGKAPYITPSQAAQDYWRGANDCDDSLATFLGSPALRVGLVWASNPAPDRSFSARRARNKTMPLDVMARLSAIPGLRACSVSNVPLVQFAGHEAARLTNMLDLAGHLTSLDRTAALIAQLDLVITVDTAVAHLAGAMGKPVWIALHSRGDVRWGKPGTPDSYWYPSARLFWQQAPGDWSELIDRVAADLRAQTRSLS